MEPVDNQLFTRNISRKFLPFGKNESESAHFLNNLANLSHREKMVSSLAKFKCAILISPFSSGLCIILSPEIFP